MHLPIGFGTGVAEGLQEQTPVLVAAKDGGPSLTAAHHMVERAFILEPEFSGHEARMASQADLSIPRADPDEVSFNCDNY